MKYAFIAGAAIGYVFGTRAGRERYEQLKEWSRQVSENPNVQEATEKLRAKGNEVAGVARGKAESLTSSAKDKAPEQVQGGEGAKAGAEPNAYPG
ncbi:YtxH domain-containing protein [Actinomadura graeca]|uniref:YtxH domain-containing protein n=1 Tax=Actinomadura graeca TaxID=2750812 RepID=A0ABX8R243_9ACTN|nr:YtxH domain-containing protein [Actinomadura graeca]QXJ25125.1 YtxH domain-containing protein [Actinomadura graeca]